MPIAKRTIYGSLIFLLLALAGFFSYQNRYFGSSLGSQDPPLPPSASVNHPSQKAELSQTELTWAGLSGTAPKFIDQGELKGLGWVEYQTQEIRRALTKEGFNLKVEYYTPSRIAHEFHKGNPICFYPTEWQNPKLLFAKKPDRLYSIPLDLEGDKTRSIYFAPNQLPRFKKHMDHLGYIKLESLLNDNSLKTVLIQDRDYGRVNQIVLELDTSGNQVVKKNFEKNIALRVVRENRQLIEMLNASRFDYAFSDSIEELDFELTHIPKSHFKEVPYSITSAKSAEDPNLIFSSITCSLHPSSFKIIPHINRWIFQLRSIYWVWNQSKHREKIDTRVPWNLGIMIDSTSQTFRGIFESGGIDFWYPLQQRHFAELALFPPSTPQLAQVTAATLPTPPPLLWRILELRKGSLALVNASLAGIRKNVGFHLRINRFFPFYETQIQEYLPPELDEALQKIDTFSSASAVPFEDLRFPDLSSVRSLVIFAPGLAPQQLQPFMKQLKKSQLEDLSFFQGLPQATSALVAELPESLKYLNLTSSSGFESDLPKQIKRLPRLQSLHLNDSQLTPPQLEELLKALPHHIKNLSLGYLRSAWNTANSKIFSERNFQSLESLDLENSALSNDHLLAITAGLPRTLRKLRLGLNVFTRRSLLPLLTRPLPNLKELDLSESLLGFSWSKTISFPRSLRRLTLQRCALKSNLFETWNFPPSLEVLDLSNNAIQDQAVKSFILKLAPHVKLLNLSNTRITDIAILSLAEAPQIKTIDQLILSENQLNSRSIHSLCQAKFKLRELDLSWNFLSDTSMKLLGQKWGNGLSSLDLSDNPISETGTRDLFEGFGSQLRDLKLGNLRGIDFKSLAKALPGELRTLSLESNQVSNEDLRDFVPSLPPHLRVLNLAGSIFDSPGAELLAKHLPPHLTSLDLERAPLAGPGLTALVRALPASLSSLRTPSGFWSEEQIRKLGAFFPPALRKLWMNHTQPTEGDLSVLFEKLPASLRSIRLHDTPLSSQAAESFRWPSGLWEFYFQGQKLDDETGLKLFKHFPPSVERLSLLGLELTNRSLRPIFSTQRPCLNNTQIYRTGVTGEIISLLGEARPQFWTYDLYGTLLSDEMIKRFTAKVFEHTRALFLSNVRVSHKSLIRLLRLLPETLEDLAIIDFGVTASQIPDLIAHLPRDLVVLHLSGNPIGDEGLRLLKAYAEKKRKEEGIPFQLLYF